MKQNTNGTTAAQVENYERLTGNEYADRLAAEYNAEKKPEPIREDKTGRECYAFALYVNGEFTRFITAESWHTQQEAEAYANGMSLCALAFRRTASIAVYKKESNDVWQLYTTRQSYNRDRMYYKIHASRLKGCELVKPTEEEERAFTALPNFHRLPFMDVAALPVGWNEPAEEIAENTERTHLLVCFNDREEYERACSHFRTDSDYYADQENDEFKTLYFPEEDGMIDRLEGDIDAELCANGFTDYHFESE